MGGTGIVNLDFKIQCQLDPIFFVPLVLFFIFAQPKTILQTTGSKMKSHTSIKHVEFVILIVFKRNGFKRRSIWSSGYGIGS